MSIKSRLAGWLGVATQSQVRKSLNTLQAKFDAAQTNNSNSRHWANADSLTADQAASPGVRQILRDRARYEVSNNSYARGMLLTYSDDLIGEGPGLQLLTQSTGFNDGVERAWSAWSKEIKLARKLRTATVCKKQDGEAFIQLFTNPKLKSPIKLDIRLIEADRVEDTSFGSRQDENTLDGIKYDQYGNAVSFQVMRQPVNPLFGATSWESDTVNSRMMIHWFREDRPGQHRGLPEIMPALPLFADLRRYTMAVIEAAETAADFNILIEAQMSPDLEDLVEPMTTADINRGMMTTLPAGYQGRQMKAEQPTQSYGDFKREIINEIGRCIGMPFNIAAANSAGYNFASGRLDHMTYDRTIAVERSDLAAVVLDHLFSEWAHEWRLVSSTMGAPFIVPPTTGESPHLWTWTPRKQADTLKEAKTLETLLKSQATTRELHWREQGLDPQKMTEAVKRESETFKEEPVQNATAEPAE